MIDGYNDWCLYILQKYTDALERLNIYGAILSSLGVYHIDFQLLQSFLECWDKDRNGQVYDEYVPTNEELEDPEVKHGQPLKALLNCYQYLRGIGKHFIIPSDGRMGKTLNGYVIWYQEGYHNFFAEEVKKLYTLCFEQNKDQIIVVPQMNRGASGSFSSVEQAIQVFFEECKDQVLCIVSSSAKVQPFMPGIYHIKSKDEILELQCQDCSILVPLRKDDKKQSDEASPTPIIDDNDDISDEGPVDPSVSSVVDALLPIFVKEFCE
ncbi:uncharacterized protein A4U43_C01F17080 [Asparagus officinalis]|uniref:Uncharacterized protein n=1 Tax=Asparagus officinalis TaxID=4686 RepID=A0A5P1FQT4_ASPOF|nr:uncharacterized protein A4U43_C01F17080 [Asparagus officinalis]